MARPNTRRASRLAAAADSADAETEPQDDLAESPVAALEAHVSNVVSSARALRQDYRKLQRKNEELAAEVADMKEQLEGEVQPKRGHKGKGPNVPQLQQQIVALKAKVRELEKTRAKDRKKIATLQAKEVKRDAEELQDQTEYEVGDSTHKMSKLLRKFHDLMLANSLEDLEECAICMSAMEVNRAISLPCQHVCCDECMRQVAATTSDEEGMFPCPTCRERTSLEDGETVVYTSSTQWDALLEVAYASAKLDRRRGELDTSDEEAEEDAAENFIDDENGESEDASSTLHEDTKPEPQSRLSSLEPPPEESLPKLRRRVLRLQTSSEHDEPGPSQRRSATNSTLTSLDEAGDEEGTDHRTPPECAATPSTPGPGVASISSYIQSPRSERRRRMEELADARQAKEKRRRYG